MMTQQLRLVSAQADSAESKAGMDKIALDNLKSEQADPSTSNWGLDLVRKQIENNKLTREAWIKDIEAQILERTAATTINSAKSRERILEQEISMNEAKNILLQLDIPERKALANWFETVGAASPAAKAVMSIGQWLKFILGK